MFLFDAIIDFLDDGIMKLYCFRCLHSLMVVDVVLIVARNEGYGIYRFFLHPQVVFMNGFIVVLALFV